MNQNVSRHVPISEVLENQCCRAGNSLSDRTDVHFQQDGALPHYVSWGSIEWPAGLADSSQLAFSLGTI